MLRGKTTPKNRLKFTSISGFAILTALATVSTASAQIQTSEIIEGDDGVDEVIVTVERRAQSLQDYAGTAAAISGEELSLLGINNIDQLDGKIPGVSIANNQGNIEVYIRGVGSSNNTELGDPAAATHLNGVYVPRPSGFGAAFFDIERVEVNIGPQGTLRGRNATAGSVDIIPWAPGIGQTDAAIEASYGNFNDYRIEAVANIAVGDKSAFRISGFKGGHDSYFNNINPDSSELNSPVPTSEDEGVGVAEEADDFGVRAAFKVKPNDALTLTVTGDYIEQKGTGYTGVNFANPLGNGIDPDDIDNPRDVVGRAFTPDEDTEHYGIKGHVEYDFGDIKAEYIGSYRDLVYNYDFATPLSPFYEGVFETLSPSDFDNFSRVNSITDSESQVHEFRLFSDNDSKLEWSAGIFYFTEDQRTFLGTTGDRNPFFTGVEFNQFTDTESISFYGDATYNVTDKFRVTGGLRFTEDDKERFGINARFGQSFIIGGDGFGCCFAPPVGTEGFQFAGFDRTIFNPDTDGNNEISSQEIIDFYFDGIETFGARDGLDDIFANGEVVDPIPFGERPLCPDNLIGFDGTSNGSCFTQATADLFGNADFDPLVDRVSFAVVAPELTDLDLQNGSIDNSFTDWRLRAEYDLSDDHLIYGLIATGNKSGGFNDNISDLEVGGLIEINPAGGAPAAFDTNSPAPTYGPETLTLFEVGSKLEFDLTNDINGHFNLSAFYYDYDDLQLTNLISTTQIGAFITGEVTDPDVALGGGGNVVAFTFNASDAEIYGAQFEGGLDLPGDVSLDATLLWLPEARVVNSQEIQDFRFQADVDPDNAVNRSIEGNRLIRTPEIQFNGSVSKAWQVDSGSIDGIVSVGYRSSQFMTIFNSIDFNPDDDVSARLDDTVDGYFTIDAGAGYNHGHDDKWRIEAYVNNLTGIEREQAIIITQFDNTRFFSPPRTYGVRVRAKF